MNRRRRTLPETMRQARRWDDIKQCYGDVGLCDSCAGQIAWGHQNGAGWRDLHQPCEICAPIIAGFPESTTNPHWRKFKRPQDHQRNGAAPVTPGSAVEDTHDLHNGPDGAAA